ncbi:photosynthetic reaction center subunit H [uncultured Rhodoblastus sp.]|uniref:photosynthetic reaction center subunit H n=1 Tax=uncultured Rhodoblastus sp. TaxID=543037 RepID=UPI0025DE86FC|nr:photosynthetic reaction center subunit H [uncultured Rhodoblastus sp.]
MIHGAIGHLDVAQIVLYAFFAFFAALIWYLRQEDRREGYPLESESDGGFRERGFLFIPDPKTFRLSDGTSILAPTYEGDARPIKAVKCDPWPGAPLEPTGEPLLAGVGPGSWAVRPDFPYQTADGHDLIAPLRVATNFAVAVEGANPLGFAAIAADGKAAGVVKDLWVDRGETVLRYYEIALDKGGSVLAPVNFVDVNGNARSIRINALTSAQIGLVPKLKNPDSVTLQEEEIIGAFYGSGTLYATHDRAEPLI